MNLREYLSIAPEVAVALREGSAVVALDSTILSQEMPFPKNLAFLDGVEQAVREQGATPATIAILHGVLKVGLSRSEREQICKGQPVKKVSRRDLPVMCALGKTGTATVAATMIVASLAGIRVFATGGIGGVHRGAETTMDISADLQELRKTSVLVVCAGATAVSDTGRTLEYLETMGVPVLGLRTAQFPVFGCQGSGFRVGHEAASEEEIARIARIKWDLGLTGGVLVANPVPQQYAMPTEEVNRAIEAGLAQAQAEGISGKGLAPYLRAYIARQTDGKSLKTSVQLVYHNARAAANIALAYEKL